MRNRNILYTLVILCLMSFQMQAQDTIKKKEGKVSLSKSVKKLERSIDTNDDYKTAKNYEELALVYQKREI